MPKAQLNINRFARLLSISIGLAVLFLIGSPNLLVGQEHAPQPTGDLNHNSISSHKQIDPPSPKSKNITGTPVSNSLKLLRKAKTTDIQDLDGPSKETNQLSIFWEKLTNSKSPHLIRIRPLPAIDVDTVDSINRETTRSKERVKEKPDSDLSKSHQVPLTWPSRVEVDSSIIKGSLEESPISERGAITTPNETAPESFRIEMAQDLEQPGESDSMWWRTRVIVPLDQRDTELINPDILLHQALQNSPFILAISKNPLIRQTNVGEACAKFDPEIFLLSQFDDRYDPVGNQLTTGTAASFLKDHLWSGDLGVRRKLMNGATLEARQQFGFQNSNSSFFDPQDQGTATLSLHYAQPLLKGRGSAYNRHQILIAQLDSTGSWDVFAAELQDELTKVVEAYWNLYFHRARLLQKENNVKRGEEVLRKLEDRSALDSLPSQIARARSAVQLRRTELANARRDIKNAETNIRRLIGSNGNFQATAPELLPEEAPSLIEPQRDLTSVIEQAMQMRPEIKQAIQRGKVAAVQKRVSEHELLPELNLIFNTYVAALKGDSDILGAWSDQFTASSPGYGVGFEFNTPYHRRAAKSINKRQAFILAQVRHEIDQTVNNVVAEAQIAWRQVDSAYQTVISAEAAISAARTDLLQNQARWNSFALIEGDLSEGQNPTTLLDQLLDAQQRLANAELTYSESLFEFKRAEVELKRATGQLLNYGPFEIPTETLTGSTVQDNTESLPKEMLPTPQTQ